MIPTEPLMKDIIHKGISAVISKIRKFVFPKQEEITVSGPGITGMRQELKMLEYEIHSIDNEKIELEKLQSDFQYRHSAELGDLLLEILRLRMILYKVDQSKYEEAERDEKQYREQVHTDRKKIKLELNNDEKKEIRKKFRKATLLCHPDKVSENLKESAQGTFIRLKTAYDSNDLKQVAEILAHLEKGDFFKSNSDTVSERELLKAEVVKLRKRLHLLEKEISSIKDSNTYKTVIAIDDWDVYFRNLKAKLEGELEEMKKEIENTTQKSKTN